MQQVKDISINDVESAYRNLYISHNSNSVMQCIKLPKLRKRTGQFNNTALHLVFFYMNLGKLVHREEIIAFVKKFSYGVASDQQPRHLKYSGWDIRLGAKAHDLWIDGSKVETGYNGLVSIDAPNTEFTTTRDKRVSIITANEWDDLLSAYDYKCAMCKTEKFLERSHKNPNLPMSDTNCIPLCSKCNNWQSKDFIVDSDGRVGSLNSPRIVLSSTKDVRRKIFEQLLKEFKDEEINVSS